jgi:hypothetical protein
MIRDGEAEWYYYPRAGERGILFSQGGLPRVRDRSCRVGEPLVLALAEGHSWAKAMLAQIQCRAEAPSV